MDWMAVAAAVPSIAVAYIIVEPARIFEPARRLVAIPGMLEPLVAAITFTAI
jgi:hypothetical protein